MKLKMILPYLLLFFAAICVFAFVLFPQEKLANQLNWMLNSSGAKVQANVERIKPALPFSLELVNSKFIIGGKQEIKPDFLKILITPDLLFGESRQVKFSSAISKGNIKGSVLFENTSPVVYKNIDIQMSGVEIERFPYNTRMARIILDCNLNGDYSFSNSNAKNAQGKGSLLINDVSADLKNSLLNRLKISNVDFSNVKIDFTKKGNNLNITQLNAKGSIINVNLKGKILLASPTSKSRLSLTGAILPDSPYLATIINSAFIRAAAKNAKKDGVRFSIKGTLEQPRIKL